MADPEDDEAGRPETGIGKDVTIGRNEKARERTMPDPAARETHP
jgi:hypothetical protein